MRVLVLFAHPVATSFGAAVHQTLVTTLAGRGHQIDDCDLNAEGFNPVMSQQDRLDYHNVKVNRARVAPYVERLLAADALAFSFPVWNMGFPAILKGFIDKVFIPGVSFNLSDNGNYAPTLRNIKKLGVACTYGGARLHTFLAGDPCRRFVTRSLRVTCGLGATCDYVALHDMNHTRADKRQAFLREVERRFSRW
ncbi:MAG TPA: NAD(P)H-dependent oxidoreductase [Roseiarcus sp.]|nr:NAD(P)H-dependent oxidoreductase [Roseiarcus sp.]